MVIEHRLRTAGLVAILGATTALLTIVHQRLCQYSIDDAYIHFRIASNLIHQGTPYFNLGEPVSGSSSPAWTLFVAAFIKLGAPLGVEGNLPFWIASLNALATLAGAIVYTHLLLRLTNKGRTVHLLAAIFFTTYVAIVLQSSMGLMETPTALLIVGVALELLISNNRFSLTLFAVAPFFRPELVIMLGLAWLYVLARKNIPYRDLILYTLLGLVPFMFYELYYFGTLVPNPIRAKSVVYNMSYENVALAIIWSIFPSGRILDSRYSLGNGQSAVIVMGLVFLTCGSHLARLLKSPAPDTKDDGIGILIMMWGAILAGAYFLARAFIQSWYFPLIVTPLLFAVSKAITHRQSRVLTLVLVTLAIPILFAQLAVLPQTVRAAFVNPAYSSQFGEGARVRQYIRLGQDLYSQYPSATLMTSEIGGLGYGFRGYVYDAVGLVSPGALRYHPMKVPEERSHGGLGAIPVGLIKEVNPELIVSYDIFIQAFLRSDAVNRYTRRQYPVFLEDDLARSGQRTLWGSNYLNVFVRKDLTESSSATNAERVGR